MALHTTQALHDRNKKIVDLTNKLTTNPFHIPNSHEIVCTNGEKSRLVET
jgi:hypothetical protein